MIYTTFWCAALVVHAVLTVVVYLWCVSRKRSREIECLKAQIKELNDIREFEAECNAVVRHKENMSFWALRRLTDRRCDSGDNTDSDTDSDASFVYSVS